MTTEIKWHDDPSEKLEKVLEDAEWTQVKAAYSLWTGGRFRITCEDQWQKAKSRLLVDEIGIFLYRFVDGQWVRTVGLSHDLIAKHLPRKRIKFEAFTLDLLTGSCNA